MKFHSLFLIAFLGIPTILFAQDLITTRKGEDVKVRVIEIGLTDVKYHLWEAPEGIISTLPKSEILLIRYEDGSKEIFEAEPSVSDIFPPTAGGGNRGVVSSLNNSSMFMRGQLDAKRYYKGDHRAATISFLTALFLGPVFGIIYPLTTAPRVPALTQLNYPSESNMRNREYARGYTTKAQHIRRNKVWLNYAIGVGIPVVVFGFFFLGHLLAR